MLAILTECDRLRQMEDGLPEARVQARVHTMAVRVYPLPRTPSAYRVDTGFRCRSTE